MQRLVEATTIPEVEKVLSQAAEERNQKLFAEAFDVLYALTKMKNKDIKNPLERKVQQGLDIFISLERARGRRGVGNRTIQRLKTVGVKQYLIDTVKMKAMSKHSGFIFTPIERHPELTSEYIVVEYASMFPKRIVELAKDRLEMFHFKVPESVERTYTSRKSAA